MKLLMHICCAPCAIYPIETVLAQKYDVTGLFYNPNVHPLEEFTKRMEQVKIIPETFGISVNFIDDFLQDAWLAMGNTPEKCRYCYDLRLERTAMFAKEHGFDAFSTTLLVSPYQNHDYIRAKCLELSKTHDVSFLYGDFREGYRIGQAKAKEMGVYRQRYCGCVFSKNN